MTLSVGLGYLICIPLATAVGRRPVIIASASITAAGTLWAGFAGGFHQLLVALALQGFGVGSAISMVSTRRPLGIGKPQDRQNLQADFVFKCIVMILDATFIHERPYALSIYWCLGSAIIKSLAIPLPFIVRITTDWRHVFQLWFVLSLVALVLLICFVPETYYVRPPVTLDGRILVQNATEKVEFFDLWSSLPDLKPLPEPPRRRRFHDRFRVSRARETEWISMASIYAQMPLCFVNPLIFWVSLLNACLLGAVIFLNLLQPSALLSAPYNGNPDTVGIYLSISGAVGALLAFPFSGPLTTWLIRFLALRNGGVRHAEVYLPSFAVPTIAGCLSVALGGIAVDREWPAFWQYVATALSMLSYNAGNVATILWITEAFPRWAASALSVVLFSGNIVCFVIGLKLTPWVKGEDIMPQSYALVGLVASVGLIAVPIAFWGKSVRQYIQCRWKLSISEKGALRPQ